MDEFHVLATLFPEKEHPSPSIPTRQPPGPQNGRSKPMSSYSTSLVSSLIPLWKRQNLWSSFLQNFSHLGTFMLSVINKTSGLATWTCTAQIKQQQLKVKSWIFVWWKLWTCYYCKFWMENDNTMTWHILVWSQ